jgi:mannose/fructose/N-acetylgalactosamine-specific phosphotransferase system component IIC
MIIGFWAAVLMIAFYIIGLAIMGLVAAVAANLLDKTVRKQKNEH